MTGITGVESYFLARPRPIQLLVGPLNDNPVAEERRCTDIARHQTIVAPLLFFASAAQRRPRSIG